MRAALAYEWVRITTVRSTYWMIGLTWFFFCGLSALLAAILDIDSFSDLPVNDIWKYITTIAITGGASITAVPILSAPFCGVLGAMAFGHEYRHGTIKQTLCAVPDRYAIFAAKMMVVAVWVLGLSALILVLNLGSAVLFMSNADVSSVAVRPMLMFALYNLAFAWVGLGLAAILRSLAGALVAVLVYPYAIEPILFTILRFTTRLGHVGQLANLLPAAAARRTMFAPYQFFANDLGDTGNTIDKVHVWGLGASALVMWAGVAITLMVGLVMFVRRDA